MKATKKDTKEKPFKKFQMSEERQWIYKLAETLGVSFEEAERRVNEVQKDYDLEGVDIQ